MIKSEEAQDPASCLSKAAEDEPIFVLRAQDLTAPDTIRYWMRNAVEHGAVIPPAKFAHAQRMIEQMEAWPKRKLPD